MKNILYKIWKRISKYLGYHKNMYLDRSMDKRMGNRDIDGYTND